LLAESGGVNLNHEKENSRPDLGHQLLLGPVIAGNVDSIHQVKVQHSLE
jgi:hypothetical protein